MSTEVPSEAQSGHVYLVGAGPGDPGLLTLRALTLIQTSDVILPDDLVSDEILALASPTANIIHVGNRTATAEGKITDRKGKLYAHATTTCMIFPAKG